MFYTLISLATYILKESKITANTKMPTAPTSATPTMGTPMEGFFDGANIVAEVITSTSDAAQGAPAKALIPSPKLGPVEESAQTKRVGEPERTHSYGCISD